MFPASGWQLGSEAVRGARASPSKAAEPGMGFGHVRDDVGHLRGDFQRN